MAQDPSSLNEFRASIDEIDNEIHLLINRRAKIAQLIGQVKKDHDGNLNDSCLYYKPDRESQVLARRMQENLGPLADKEIARIFRELMSSCLALESPLSVGYLGPEGTFTEIAALKHFGGAVATKALNSIDEVFKEVEAGTVDFGVVPVENSTEGIVSITFECFLNTKLQICGEVETRIHQNLLVSANTEFESIRSVYSHQQSLAQCRNWINCNLPNAKVISVSSNAEAARIVANAGRSDYGAIGSSRAGEVYDLKVKAEKIEDKTNNTTRFIVLGEKNTDPSGRDKTSIIASLENKPGALYELLSPFKEAGIDMTKLESRPSHSELWSYRFFIDFIGHKNEPDIKRFLEVIREQTLDLKILGSYPRAVI